MRVGILGIEYHLPERVVTNDDLSRENPDWRMDDIYAKSGIRERHVASDGETAADLGFLAAQRLLSRSVVKTEEIGYLVFCSQGPDYFLPTTACILQNRLGLPKDTGALDINLGCSGFVYGLQLAKSLVISGQTRNVLLVTADTYSKFINPRDRTVRTLFGDGGAAALIGATDSGAEIGEFVVGTDGAGATKLIVPSGGLRKPRSHETAHEVTDDAGCTRSQNDLFMDGPAIFNFAITVVPSAVKKLLEKANLSVRDADLFVYHQANKFMLDHLARRSRIPPEKMVIDLEEIGNTVSSSIPIALHRCAASGRLSAGHRVILVGFGVGYSWAVCDITWG